MSWKQHHQIYTFKGLLWVWEFRSMRLRERKGEKGSKEEATWVSLPTFFVLMTLLWMWHAERLNDLGFIMVSSQTAWREDVSQDIDFTSLRSPSSLSGTVCCGYTCVCSDAVLAETVFNTGISHTWGCTNGLFLMKIKRQELKASTQS